MVLFSAAAMLPLMGLVLSFPFKVSKVPLGISKSCLRWGWLDVPLPRALRCVCLVLGSCG